LKTLAFVFTCYTEHTVMYYVSFVLFLRQLCLAHAFIFLENFPPYASASFALHFTHCPTKSRSNWLQSQKSPQIPNTHYNKTCNDFPRLTDVIVTPYPRQNCVGNSLKNLGPS